MRKGAEASAGRFCVRVLEVDQHTQQRPRFPFQYAPYGLPQAERLVEKYRLDRVVEGLSTEFERQRALMHWLNGQWSSKRRLLGPRFRVEDLIDSARTRGTGGFCTYFSAGLTQLAAALGYIARPINCDTVWTLFGRRHLGHMINDIWSNQHRKWIVVDSHFNLHWEKSGVPLSALELRDEFFANGGRDVETFWGTSRRPLHMSEEIAGAHHAAHMAVFVVFTTNNLFTDDWRMKLYRVLMYRDHRNAGFQWVSKDGRKRHYADEGQMIETDRRNDLEWQEGRTGFTVELKREGRMAIHLATYCANFSHFETSRDGRRWRRSAEDVTLQLRPDGRNEFHARAVSLFGVAGAPSRIKLSVKENRHAGQGAV